MAGFKTQSKRIRELAKQNKRRAKDEKRAIRKAERSGTSVAIVPAVAPAAVPASPPKSAAVGRYAVVAAPVVERKPLTLAEAVERWKSTKVVKAKGR
jgi:hypothetical protein